MFENRKFGVQNSTLILENQQTHYTYKANFQNLSSLINVNFTYFNSTSRI